MKDESLNLGQIQAAIQQAGASWMAGLTSLTELVPSEKRLRLGAVPPGEAMGVTQPRPTTLASLYRSLPPAMSVKSLGCLHRY